MRTFDEAFAELNLKPAERAALVWHLAAIRTRKLIETLLPEPKPDDEMMKVLRADRPEMFGPRPGTQSSTERKAHSAERLRGSPNPTPQGR